MLDIANWPPRVGEPIGRQRATSALIAAGADIRRVCGEVAARVTELSPGARVATAMLTAADLGSEVRQPLAAGCPVALVGYVDRGGRLTVVPVELGWGGEVYPRTARALPAAHSESTSHCTMQWLPRRHVPASCSDGSTPHSR